MCSFMVSKGREPISAPVAVLALSVLFAAPWDELRADVAQCVVVSQHG